MAMTNPIRQAEPVSTRVSLWGEGPFWHAAALWYVDINGKALLRFDPASGVETAWNMDQRIGFARPSSDGQLIWGGDRGLYFRDPETECSRLIPGTEPESPDHRYNDAGTAPDGLLFAGTISLKKQSGSANLYRLDAKGQRRIACPGVTNSNGIGWSPDGKTAYYIDTPTRRILSFDYRDGQLLSPKVLADTSFTEASPDGLCVDVEGHLWVAFCHGGCVRRFHGRSGALLATFPLPCVETTACAFGGPSLSDLYITTGRHATRDETLGGRLFVIRDVGVAGMPVLPYKRFC